MFQKLFFLAALASVSVSAQESSASATGSGVAAPTSTAGIPPCVLTCSAQAGAAAGCTFSDPACACSTTNGFQDAATQCLLSTCTAEEQQAALGLQGALCGAASSGAFSDSVSATGSATTEAVSSSPSATSPLSSASVATTTPLSAPSVTRPATSASTSAPATSGSGTPAPANTSNAAMGIMRVGGEQAALFGAGVAVVGALLGAAMVL